MDKQPPRSTSSLLRSVTGKKKASFVPNAAGRSNSRPISGFAPRLSHTTSSHVSPTPTSSPGEDYITPDEDCPITSPIVGPSTSPYSASSSSPTNEENEVLDEQEPIGSPTMQRTGRAPRMPPSEKKLLQPRGDHDYVDNSVGTRAITNVFKSRLTQPYNDVGDMTEQELVSWFYDWKKYCTWDPKYEGHFYKALKHHLGQRMSDIYYMIRNKEKKPGWMLDEVYTALCERWSTPEFQAVRERNARNRKSKQGSSVYTGGSISMHTRIASLEEQFKKKVDVDVAFVDGYVKRADKGKAVEDWEEGVARDTALKYKELVAEQEQRLAEDPESHVLDSVELWTLAAGGRDKKGRILGLNHMPKRKNVVPSPLSDCTSGFSSSQSGPYMTNEQLTEVLGNMSGTLT